MASKQTRRSPTKKRAPKKGPFDDILEALARPGFIGSLLVLLAVFTLLSLISGSNGSLTGAWIGGLRGLFGAGVWLVPLLAGLLGVWMVIRAMEQAPPLPWMRPLGLAVFFLAFVTAASLLLAPEVRARVTPEGGAGGRLGTAVADLLESTVTTIGAWAVVTFLFFAALIFITDRLLIDLGVRLWGRTQSALEPRPREPVVIGGRDTIDPALPLPRGELAWWRRLRERVLPPKDDFDLLPAPDVLPAPVSAASPASQGGAGAANPPRVGPAAPLTEPGMLPPKIIGGAQEWRLPRLADTLKDWDRHTDSDELIRDQGRLIQETLALFGVPADFEGAYKGPSVTQYLIKPGYVERNIKGEAQRIKVKVAKIAALANDLALALAASSVRIEAPIPGTNYVGVEVPNRESNVVGLKELMESDTFTGMKGRLRIALGEDVKGQPVVADLARMPHLLIAGATGSGKSVCINSIITCLLLAHTPETLRLLLIDPKMVELSIYNGIPHLLSPVVTEVEKAAGVLFWAVKEMERRYTLFSKAGARDLIRYNEFLQKRGEKPLPYIVVIVDEMADLMMASPEEVEKHICRLAQMARATGIHLIIATQRPSVDVITGLIKANFPARIAFAVTSQVDSRVILDIPGAERLLGRGDMLFMAPDSSKLERLQGTYLSDEEINRLVRYWKGIRVLEGGGAHMPWEHGTGEEPPAPLPGAPPQSAPSTGAAAPEPAAGGKLEQPPLFQQIETMRAEANRDVLYDEAERVVRDAGYASGRLLERHLRIGYGRAARLLEQLEQAGVVGPEQPGTHKREIIPPGGKAAPGAPATSAASQPPAKPPGRPTGGARPPAQPPPPSGPPPRIIGGDPGDDPGDEPREPRVWM